MSSFRSAHLAGSCILLLLLVAACASTTQRFPQDVQTAISRGDMQRLETDELVVYYPRGKRDAALRAARRLEHCRKELEKSTPAHWGPARQKSMFILPDLPFNNAFVAPAGFGIETQAVLPLSNTADYFAPMGIPPDPGYIGCHEMTHDMVFRQVTRRALAIRYGFGRGSYSPLMGLDAWFQEGIAVYEETRLQGRGRLWTPYFDGVFASGLHEQRLSGGWMSTFHRTPQFGGHYLIGSRFIDYLARTYGEEKLWQLVGRQSRVILAPLGVGSRFKRVYGLDDGVRMRGDDGARANPRSVGGVLPVLPQARESDGTVVGPCERVRLFARFRARTDGAPFEEAVR